MTLTISLAILLFSTLSTADDPKQNGEECSCFLTNGSSSGYFNFHRFHDFRNIESNFTGIPNIINSFDNDSNLVPTSNFFDSSGWENDWDIQTWNNSDSLAPDNFKTGDPTVLMRNSANNIYIQQSSDSNSNYSTYLTLRTARVPGFQTAAEMDSTRGNYFHLSTRFLARVNGSPGAVAGMFTYLSNTNPQDVEEIDTEILTRGPTSVVQYTNQPSSNTNGDLVAGTTTNTTIPNEIDWTQWNVYRLDWMDDASTWYINGEEVSRIQKNVPTQPSMLILNMWSDGSSWPGNMSVGGEATLEVQWIETVFNTSGSYAGSINNNKRSMRNGEDEFEVVERDGHNSNGQLLRKRGNKGCTVVCGIDDVPDIGTPVLLANNSAPSLRTMLPVFGSTSLLSWVPLIVTAVLGMLFI